MEICLGLVTTWIFILEKEPKGRRDVDLPQDDYFMALAVLAKSRSPFLEEKVSDLHL